MRLSTSYPLPPSLYLSLSLSCFPFKYISFSFVFFTYSARIANWSFFVMFPYYSHMLYIHFVLENGLHISINLTVRFWIYWHCKYCLHEKNLDKVLFKPTLNFVLTEHCLCCLYIAKTCNMVVFIWNLTLKYVSDPGIWVVKSGTSLFRPVLVHKASIVKLYRRFFIPGYHARLILSTSKPRRCWTERLLRHDISWELSAGRRFSCNIIPYFFWKFGRIM